MSNSEFVRHISLAPADNRRLAILCGELNENLRIIERHFGVEINNRGNEFEIIGIPMSVDKACEILQKLYAETSAGHELTNQQIQLMMKSMDMKFEFNSAEFQKKLDEATLKLNLDSVKPRTANQIHYIRSIQKYDINFGIGPSGTGKTYLAVACALHALQNDQVKRIILVRPAVEAGENLGFLPGDLAEKIDPYLRPLYDALYEMAGATAIAKLMEKGAIEIAPLAYMRGRTLNDAFIILDEGQNTSKEQMKMFLTRIGFGSKALITGDITQIDLPPRMESGLRHAITLLRDIPAIRFSFFQAADVVRHPLVQQIIEAYEKEDS
jgi:phosphate starvation-inducible protein PhoH and related proteins